MSLKLLNVIFFFGIVLTLSTFNRRSLTYKGITIISLLNNVILLAYCSLNWTVYVVKYAAENCSLKIHANTWLNINYVLDFKITSLSFLFIFLVIIISFATNIYILNYFKYEERCEEFTLLINWFVLSMILLVSSNNFFTFILGWELIGITSFLLINFWKFKTLTLTCSFKAFTFNKFSDLFLMIGFCILWSTYRVNNIDTLLTLISFNKSQNINSLRLAGICLIICSSIKSAQILGHLWLPDSMEAPVPASSLIHSATLVSAGIFLILRFQPLFLITDLMGVIFIIGSITACYGGIVAASQSDVKKLLAYSTISHCGFIMSSIALNNFLLTITYLYIHGLFKAATFFCVGSFIKSTGTQDMRFMGMLKTKIFDTTALIATAINLGGLPFTFGYMYKSLFLSHLIINSYNIIGYGFCIIGMLSSLVYVYKLIYYSCFDYDKGSFDMVGMILQNYPSLQSKFSSDFTLSKVFAFFIIYIYSVLFFLVMKLYILKVYLFIQYSPTIMTNELNFLNDYLLLKSYLVSIFYTLFTAVIFILFINSNRTNYFFLEKISLVKQILLFILIYRLVNFIIHYLNFFLLL